jgi:NitT/TauT family transport system permease protein
MITPDKTSGPANHASLSDVPPPKPKVGAGLLGVFAPNAVVSVGVMRLLIALQVGLFFVLWSVSPYKALPRPGEVWTALGNLWTTQGLAQELITSFVFNLQALAWSAAISLGLAYLTVLPFFRPIVNAVSRGRFLSLVGFSLLFMLLLKDAGKVKLALLVFGMTVYFVTSMASVIAAIPKSDFDYARRSEMARWRVVRSRRSRHGR